MTTIALDPLVVFQAVVETGSFTRAARKLGMDKARVSRVVAALEASVDALLFVRTTRVVRPTPEGLALSARIASHLAALQAAVSAVPDRAAIPSGEVVVASTTDLARFVMAPILARIRERFPAVRLRLVLSEHLVDLDAQQVDVAVRVGHRGPGSFVARKLGELGAGFFAAPSYLARRGTPASAADFADHDGLWPALRRASGPFTIPGVRAPRDAAFACDDFATLRALARAGAGIAVLPAFMAQSDVAAGALVRVLPDARMQRATVWLVSRAAEKLAPRVAAVRTALLDALPPALAA